MLINLRGNIKFPAVTYTLRNLTPLIFIREPTPFIPLPLIKKGDGVTKNN